MKTRQTIRRTKLLEALESEEFKALKRAVIGKENNKIILANMLCISTSKVCPLKGGPLFRKSIQFQYFRRKLKYFYTNNILIIGDTSFTKFNLEEHDLK